MSKVKTKIIEAVLHNAGDKKLLKIVYRANTIERVIADMQQLHPRKKISMSSIIMWKFITEDEANQYKPLTP